MSYCSVYIGDLDDPEFHLDKQMTINIPQPLSRSFPPTREHYNALFHQWIKYKGIACTQTDYNGWVALVSKEQILDYIDFAYGADRSYADPEHMLRSDGRPYLVDRLNEVKAFISRLVEGKRYALVAECD